MADHQNNPLAELIQRNVARELRKYHGNLTFAVQIVRNNWLPALDAPGVQQHLETLRQHMAEIGHPESDPFLLRLGLTVPGTQRGIVPPMMVLDENRGGFSTRRQREAEGQIRRLREALALGHQFLPNLSLNTATAIAQLAEVATTQFVPKDSDWLHWYQGLSADQSRQLAERALEWLFSDAKPIHDIGQESLQQLACFRNAPLSEGCCFTLIAHGILWPASVYRDSGDAVAAELLVKLDLRDELPLNLLLLALAWTRSHAAYEAFRQWIDFPPDWASELHVPPSEYLPYAGWCIDDEGQRKDLISLWCFRLLPAADAASDAIGCRVPANDTCPSCGGNLAWLFDFSRAGNKFFRGELAEAPRRILSCMHCSCYEPTFASYRPDGTSTLVAPSEPCKFPYAGDRASFARTLEGSPCPPFACAEPFALDDASTLGGIPMWLQDAEFPRCIECGERMIFLAQHDNSPLREEGVYYAFFCGRCSVSAVTYQQT